MEKQMKRALSGLWAFIKLELLGALLVGIIGAVALSL